jgi:hypothetical protein
MQEIFNIHSGYIRGTMKTRFLSFIIYYRFGRDINIPGSKAEPHSIYLITSRSLAFTESAQRQSLRLHVIANTDSAKDQKVQTAGQRRSRQFIDCRSSQMDGITRAWNTADKTKYGQNRKRQTKY